MLDVDHPPGWKHHQGAVIDLAHGTDAAGGHGMEATVAIPEHDVAADTFALGKYGVSPHHDAVIPRPADVWSAISPATSSPVSERAAVTASMIAVTAPRCSRTNATDS